MIRYEFDQVSLKKVVLSASIIRLLRYTSSDYLRLWQQEKISELTMDVSKDLARDFHLERFTIQEFYADCERQNLNPDKRP